MSFVCLRRRGLTRVCKRWRRLVDSPELLRHVSVRLAAVDPCECTDEEEEGYGSKGSGCGQEGGRCGYQWSHEEDPERPVRHILRCFAWLRRRAAPHVEALTVSLGSLDLDDELEYALESALERQEDVTDALRTALNACTRLQVGGQAADARGGGALVQPDLPLPRPRPRCTPSQTDPLPLLALQRLTLDAGCAFRLHAGQHLAPAAQRSLRFLSVTIMGTGLKVAGLTALTALQSLHLHGNPLELGGLVSSGGWHPLLAGAGDRDPPQPQALPPGQPDAAALPHSLTSLTLDGYVDFSSSVRQFVPPQVGWACLGGRPCTASSSACFQFCLVPKTALCTPDAHAPPVLLHPHPLRQITALTSPRRLALGDLPIMSSGADFSSLTALGALTALQLMQTAHLPTCLPCLPLLRALRLDDSPFGVAAYFSLDQSSLALAELSSALRQVAEGAVAGQRLEHLVLERVRRLPPEVAALPRLQTLYWVEQECGELPPSGPYTTSLRRLALASRVAAASTAALAAMPALEALAIVGPGSPQGITTEASVVEWAAQQQPASLRRLAVSYDARSFERGSWPWGKYAEPLQARVEQLQLPPRLRFELGNALLHELRKF